VPTRRSGFEQEAAAHFIRQVLRSGDRSGRLRVPMKRRPPDPARALAFSDNVGICKRRFAGFPAGAGTSDLRRCSPDVHARSDAVRTTAAASSSWLLTRAKPPAGRFRRRATEPVRSNALLYTIVIRPVKRKAAATTAGEHALETDATPRAAPLFYPDEPQELGAISIASTASSGTQYLLAYYPTPRGPATTLPLHRVTVTPAGYHVRHRKSYLTGPQ